MALHPYDEIIGLTGGPVSYELEPWGHIKLREYAFPASIQKLEFDIIRTIVKSYNLKRGYECATAFGVSSVAAGLAFKETGGKLVTMDAYVEELFNNCNDYRGKKPVTYADSDNYKSAKFLHNHFGLNDTVFAEVGWSPRDTASVISKHFGPEEKLDFVFIDAGHFPEQVIQDIDSFVPFLAEKNVLMFHDVYDSVFDATVKNRVRELFGKDIEIIVPNETGRGDNLGILINM